MRHVAVGQQRWIMQGLVPSHFPLSGFGRRIPLADPGANALSGGSQVYPRWCVHRHVLRQWRYLWLRVQRDGELGDGVITNVANIVDGQTLTHTYAAAGIYTVHITGAGTPTSPDAFCTFNPNTIVTVRTHVQT